MISIYANAIIVNHNLEIVQLIMFNVYKFQKNPIYDTISLLRFKYSLTKS